MKILKYINKLLPIFKNKNDLSLFKNVLVVSNTGLGDTILGTPAMKTLRKSFPDLNITFLVNKKMYPLFEGIEFVNDILTYQSGFVNQLGLVKKLREKKIDTIFLLHSNGPEDIFFSICSGACNILKLSDSKNHPYEKIFLNKLQKYDSHIIEEKIKLIDCFNPTIIDRTMEISPKFTKQPSKSKQLNIGFQIGTQDLYKIWPIDKFVALAQLILENHDCKITLLGATKYEIQSSEYLISKTALEDQIVNLCGKSTIEELPLIVNDLDLLVTNDTGTLHLAIAQQIPSISLFGPTHHKFYGPYQDLEIHDVIQKDGSFVNDKPKKKRTQEGMDLISVDEVYQLFEKRIKIL